MPTIRKVATTRIAIPRWDETTRIYREGMRAGRVPRPSDFGSVQAATLLSPNYTRTRLSRRLCGNDEVDHTYCRTDRLFPPEIAPAGMRDLAAAGVDALRRRR